MANLLATKPLNLLMEEARETGEHSLKRTLGVFQLTALGVGAIIGAGIFVMVGLGAQYAGPGTHFVVRSVRTGLRLCRTLLRGVRGHDSTGGQRLHLRLCDAGRIAGVDHRLGFDARIRDGRQHGFFRLVESLHRTAEYFSYQDAALAGLRSLDGAEDRGEHDRTADGEAADSSLVAGSQAFLDKVSAITGTQSPELLQRAHELLGAPHLFGMEVGFNLPAFIIALVITAILVVGIKESARFNAGIVVIKVSVVLFVIALGARYINVSNWGTDWHSYAPNGFAGIGAGAAYIFFAYIGFDAVSTTAQEAKNPQRDLPIGMIASLAICTVLYIAVAGVLTGMVHWQQINIEAPVARAFLDRGLTTASHIITLGALAGLTSVMLVMLLGQTRVLYSMANDGLLPKKFFAAVHPEIPHAVEEHDSRGPAGGDRGEPDADR